MDKIAIRPGSEGGGKDRAFDLIYSWTLGVQQSEHSIRTQMLVMLSKGREVCRCAIRRSNRAMKHPLRTRIHHEEHPLRVQDKVYSVRAFACRLFDSALFLAFEADVVP